MSDIEWGKLNELAQPLIEHCQREGIKLAVFAGSDNGGSKQRALFIGGDLAVKNMLVATMYKNSKASLIIEAAYKERAIGIVLQ